MEGIALAEPFFLLAPLPPGGGVEPRQGAHDADDMSIVPPGIPQAVRLEQAPPQHLRNIFPADGLDAFLLLPPDDVEQVGLESLAQLVLPALIGGEQRRDEGRPVHLGDGLHEMLEEVDDPLSPDSVHARLAARIHQHLVDQNQGCESPLLRKGQQPCEGSGSAGGVSRSSSSASPCIARSPSAPAS